MQEVFRDINDLQHRLERIEAKEAIPHGMVRTSLSSGESMTVPAGYGLVIPSTFTLDGDLTIDGDVVITG